MKNMFKNWAFSIGTLCLTACLAPAFAQNQLIKPEIREEIFPRQTQHVHGSSLVALPNGDLLSVWFQGSGERTADDVVLMGSRKVKSSSTWSTPFLMADTPGIPD